MPFGTCSDASCIWSATGSVKKPLYYGWAGNSFVFGSELKAIHAHPDFTPDLNRDVLSLYMRFGYVCAPHSIFKNIWQLPPGGMLTIDPAALVPGENLSTRTAQYWTLREVVERGRANPVANNESAIIEEFEGMLSLAVKRRMVADVPLGVFLSGGIDSSLVTALMQKHASHPVKSFSIGFSEDGYDESAAAARVAQHLGTDHKTFLVSAQDALDVIPTLPDMYDEPFADASQIPTFLVAKLARQHVTVALTGDGGDEILGGYQRHTHIPALWDKISWLPAPLRRTAAAVMQSIPQPAYDRLSAYPQLGRRLHRLASVVGQGDSDGLYTALLQVWKPEDRVIPGATMPLIPLDDPAQWPNGLSLAEKMMYGDQLSYRPDDLMVKTDRAAMAVALEARAPLMDYELCEYSWRLPMPMKIRGLEGKWLLRRILEKHVPREMWDRPKAGFNIPLRSWLNGPLRGWADDLLSPQRLKSQNIVNAELVTTRWKDFKEGRSGHANATDLWAMLMFQAWHDRWLGDKGGRS